MSKLMDVVNDKIEPDDYVDVDVLIDEFEKHCFETSYGYITGGPGVCWNILVVRDGEDAVEITTEGEWIGSVESVVIDVRELDRGEKSFVED